MVFTQLAAAGQLKRYACLQSSCSGGRQAEGGVRYRHAEHADLRGAMVSVLRCGLGVQGPCNLLTTHQRRLADRPAD